MSEILKDNRTPDGECPRGLAVLANMVNKVVRLIWETMYPRPKDVSPAMEADVRRSFALMERYLAEVLLPAYPYEDDPERWVLNGIERAIQELSDTAQISPKELFRSYKSERYYRRVLRLQILRELYEYSDLTPEDIDRLEIRA